MESKSTTNFKKQLLALRDEIETNLHNLEAVKIANEKNDEKAREEADRLWAISDQNVNEKTVTAQLFAHENWDDIDFTSSCEDKRSLMQLARIYLTDEVMNDLEELHLFKL